MKAAPDSYLVQIHDQQKLDQEQGNGEEPVHVAIGVVEGFSGGHVRARISERVGTLPTVEDTPVVVTGNSDDQGGHHHGGSVLGRELLAQVTQHLVRGRVRVRVRARVRVRVRVRVR